MEKVLASYGLNGLDRQRAELLSFEADQAIVRQGERCGGVHLLCEGFARIEILSGEGKSLLIGEYRNRGLIGDLELVLSSGWSTTVTAISPVKTLFLPFSFYRKELLRSAPFLLLVAKNLAKSLQASSYANARRAYFPLEQRLAAYLLANAKKGVFRDNLSEVSRKLGTSYRHLFRVLHSLCSQGLLEKRGTAFYRIADRESLEDSVKEMEGESTSLPS